MEKFTGLEEGSEMEDMTEARDIHSHSMEEVDRGEAELRDVLEDLKDLSEIDADDEDEDNGHEDCEDYPRTVSFRIPKEAADLHDVRWLEVPICKLLELFAGEVPQKAQQMMALRNDFFSGDHEDDHMWSCSASADGGLTWEERAVLRLDRRRGAHQRRITRAEVKARFAADHAADWDRWQPFEKQFSAIQLEFEELDAVKRALEARWEGFVLERETWTRDRQRREDDRRAELLNETEQYQARDAGAMQASDDLHERMLDYWERYEQEETKCMGPAK